MISNWLKYQLYMIWIKNVITRWNKQVLTFGLNYFFFFLIGNCKNCLKESAPLQTIIFYIIIYIALNRLSKLEKRMEQQQINRI
jgi:hypothetical protein